MSLSSTEAEFIALCEAVKEVLWIQNSLYDINRMNDFSTVIYEDNQSCIKMIQNEKIPNRSKHIDIKYYFVKDILRRGRVDLKYCATNDMLADLFTKPLSCIRFAKLRENLNLQN